MVDMVPVLRADARKRRCGIGDRGAKGKGAQLKVASRKGGSVGPYMGERACVRAPGEPTSVGVHHVGILRVLRKSESQRAIASLWTIGVQTF
jgi:hypothetical protein